ncbi:hypothetical protein GGS23DRAFT_592626 [Durotheca rogersii]|uniref:uncharacterized protein n=1 Tax=Durotheca rogersii TaxID=419775 RepID=UPI002220EE81|nr:uncharacterized protein GGS23DRAFT_592626 [Durotheca rogersii]KAI5867300.1 hypothetical protein GGS23DRAFT_592626 [Durotheca rogersii]
MRFSPLLGLGWLSADIHTSFGNSTQQLDGPVAPSPVYVLRTTHPATAALGKALDTLGYRRRHHGPRQQSLEGDLDYREATPANTYIEVPSTAQFVEIARSEPNARFILPRGAASSDHAQPVRSFFARESRSRQLLELDVLALERAAQADNWVALCDYLGLGYSVVERLGLWRFPR